MDVLDPSVYVVLIIGNTFGAVVKGITGFGSAIINLCVWVTAVSLDINAGPLQLAVVAECICSEVLAIPLLFLTKAHKTADARLVVTIFIFETVGAPFGAWLLLGLNPRIVELVVALVLMLMIFLHCKLHTRAQQGIQWLLSKASAINRCSSFGRPYGRLDLDGNDPSSRSQPAAAGWAEATVTKVQMAEQQPAVIDITAEAQQQGCGRQSITRQLAFDDESGLQAVSSITSTGPASGGPSTTEAPAGGSCCQHACSTAPLSSASSTQQALDTGTAAISVTQSSRCAHAEPSTEPDCERASLLQHQQLSASDPEAHTCSSSTPSTSNAAAGTIFQRSWRWMSQCWQRVCEQWTDPAKRREMLRITGYGSLAGTAAGIMAGMTGMGGPPLMFLYEKMQVPKDVVRGTNAVLNMLQPRIIFYIIMGVVQAQHTTLFVLCMLGSTVGTVLGNALASRMDQATFSRMLVGLMVMCGVLMLCSAAGIGQ